VILAVIALVGLFVVLHLAGALDSGIH